jgi:hypothetical protein
LYLVSTNPNAPVSGYSSAVGGSSDGGAGGAANATSDITSRNLGYANAAAVGGAGATLGAATAVANAIGGTASSAEASAQGASGQASAMSEAELGSTVITSASAQTTLNGVNAYTQANVGGASFAKAPASDNGYNAYSYASASPTATASTGSTMLGAGVLGGNGSGASATYAAQATYDLNLSGKNNLTIGLLNLASYGGGFSDLTFTVKDGSATVLTDSFTTLASAEAFFTDDPLSPKSLQNLSGAVDLSLDYQITAKGGEGAGIAYVLGDKRTATNVPEIDSSSALSAATLLLGSLMVLRRRHARKQTDTIVP